MVKVHGKLGQVSQLVLRQKEVSRVVVLTIIQRRVQFLVKQHLGQEVVLYAQFHDSRPVLRHEFELCVVVLDPFSLRCDLSFHLTQLLLDIGVVADQVLHLNEDAPEESQVVTSFSEADHASQNVVLRHLLARVADVSQVEHLLD